MSNKEYPSYAALVSANAHSKSQQSLLEKFTVWFRNFLETAE